MENKEKMTVREFAEKYTKLQSDKTRENLIDSIIVRHYAPILKKRSALELIFEKCVQEKDGIKYIDSFLVQIGLMQAVLVLYTNLETKHKENEEDTIFTDYDLLMETGIYPIIMYKIGEKDIKELMNIYSSIEETFMNQQTFEAYLAKQVTRFGELFGRVSGSGLEAVAKVLEDEEKMKPLIDMLETGMKKGKFNLMK
jgi:hypothetical protein